MVGLRPSLDRQPTIGTEASIEVKAKTRAVFRYSSRNPAKNQKKDARMELSRVTWTCLEWSPVS